MVPAVLVAVAMEGVVCQSSPWVEGVEGVEGDQHFRREDHNRVGSFSSGSISSGILDRFVM